MSDFRDGRTPPLYRSTTAPATPSLGYGYNAGDIPPELSPLDELAIRGRMLRKQLVATDGKVGLNPQTVHRSLRRPDRSPGPASVGLLERSFSLGSQQNFGAMVGGIGVHFTSPKESERPVSSHPRFSNASVVPSIRDSSASTLTTRHDNLPTSPHTPNFPNTPDRQFPPHSFDFGGGAAGRPERRPEPENQTADARRPPEDARRPPADARRPPADARRPPADARRPPADPRRPPADARRPPADRREEHIGGGHGFKKSEVPAPPVRHDSGHEVPESECESIQEDRIGPLTTAMRSVQRERSISPATRQPQPQNGIIYQAYNPNLHAPGRRPSGASEIGTLRAPRPRQDSRDSSRGRSPHPPSRAGSNSANDTSNEVPNSILPLLNTIRAESPEDMESSPSYPPSPLPPSANREDNYDWLHDFQRAASGPSTPRPPSSGSQRSFHTIGGSRNTSKAINFSRPMLSARPSVDISAVNDYLRSSNPNENSPLQTPTDQAETPIGTAETHDAAAVTSSYTYTKFYLPRGRTLDRNSLVFVDEPIIERDGSHQPQQRQPPQQRPQAQQQQQQQQSDQPQAQRKPSYTAYSPNAHLSKAPPTADANPRSQPSPDSSDYVSKVLRQQSQPKGQRPPTSAPLAQSPTPRTPVLAPPGGMTPNMNRTLIPNNLQAPKMPRPSPSKENLAPAATLTPDEHVTLGIEKHEDGVLQESSYHLRLAANAGHPTGMLLYALAVRHGWGMKANPQEAIVWLKKVIHLAGGDVTDTESIGTGASDFFEKQGRKAQFALSIYELGMCHLNGWGTEVDKTYALRCFEIAGSKLNSPPPSPPCLPSQVSTDAMIVIGWGDADALSEAGYCYYHGVGTKKDLRRSAKYYRMAEAKGVNMVGNSW